jgi:hypothetical protein
VGLYRVEFLYTLEKPPNEERLLNALIRSAEFFKGKEIIIRAPDLGGDKSVPYLRLKEPNPFLGLRGIRPLLEYNEEILMPFLRAFVRRGGANQSHRHCGSSTHTTPNKAPKPRSRRGRVLVFCFFFLFCFLHVGCYKPPWDIIIGLPWEALYLLNLGVGGLGV